MEIYNIGIYPNNSSKTDFYAVLETDLGNIRLTQRDVMKLSTLTDYLITKNFRF